MAQHQVIGLHDFYLEKQSGQWHCMRLTASTNHKSGGHDWGLAGKMTILRRSPSPSLSV
jgi:hypothetical protein